MTEFLSCQPEAENSATGPERPERGVGRREREKNAGIPMSFCLSAQLQPKERVREVDTRVTVPRSGGEIS